MPGRFIIGKIDANTFVIEFGRKMAIGGINAFELKIRSYTTIVNKRRYNHSSGTPQKLL
jgi:hypothetical protein